MVGLDDIRDLFQTKCHPDSVKILISPGRKCQMANATQAEQKLATKNALPRIILQPNSELLCLQCSHPSQHLGKTSQATVDAVQIPSSLPLSEEKL